MSIAAYPLCWPDGWKRQPAARRVRGKFNSSSWQAYTSPGMTGGRTVKREISVSDGTERILAELARLGISDRQDIVISTNVRLRLDGLPRSGEPEPDDPGAAVYWTDIGMNNAPRCMAIDIYDRVSDNLGAVAATIEAMRAIERHGGAEILNRAFTGFTSLPAPGQATAMGWREVLGLNGDTTAEQVDAAYRRLRSLHHPDKGGSAETFHAVQTAYEQARQEIRP